MRVTQKNMYGTMLNGMNSTLSDYMESLLQSGSQKRVNRPSDDPAGTSNILSYRSSIALTKQHINNSNTAQGWLGLADQTLGNVATNIGRIRTLAEQASTETYTAEQRATIAKEIRELMGTIINQSNTTFEGKHIFGGQEYKNEAFVEGLALTGKNTTVTGSPQVSGTLKSTAMVRFADDVTLPLNVGDADAAYQYTLDGGKTWESGVMQAPINAGDPVFMDVDGARVTFPPGSSIDVTGYGASENLDKVSEGSSLLLRPAVIYQGADNNATPTVNQYGTVNIPSDINFSTTGSFPANVMVRFDQQVDLAANGAFEFSYSPDNGATWISGNKSEVTGTPPNSTARLVVPGGFVDVNLSAMPVDTRIPAGAQINIQPQRTSLEYEIAPGQTLSVNNIGKDIFGGLYRENNGNTLVPAFGKDNPDNLFETIGNLIGALETNNVDGISSGLEAIESSAKKVLQENAIIGGKENRVEVTLASLDSVQINQTGRMSEIEDIDITELLTKISQQQIAYQSVLKSSSMIMNMSLLNFV